MYRENKNRWERRKEDRELVKMSAKVLGETVKIPEEALLEIISKKIAGREITGKELLVLNSLGTRKQILHETVVSQMNLKKELFEKEGKTLEVTPETILELFKKRMETLTKSPFVVVVKTTTPAVPTPTPAPTAISAPPEEPKKEKVLWPEEKVSQRPVSRPKDRPIVENKKFVRAVRVILAQLNKEEAELVVKYQGRYMIPIVKEGMPFVRPEKEGFHVGVWWEGEEPEFLVGRTPVFPIRILPVQTTLEGDFLLVARTESLEVELNLKPLGNTVIYVVKNNIDSVWIRNENEERPFKPMMGERSRVYHKLCEEEKKASPTGRNPWRMDDQGIITPPATRTAMPTDEVLDVIQKTLSEDREKAAREERKVTVPETVTQNAETIPVPA